MLASTKTVDRQVERMSFRFMANLLAVRASGTRAYPARRREVTKFGGVARME
jgi:hypothetical protein